MKAFSDIFRSQICVQVGAHGVFQSICICGKDSFGRSRLCSLRHRRAAQGGASGGKQKSLRAQSCMAGSASADRSSLGCILFSAQRLGGRKLLVGKAGRAICHMDDAAAGKAVLFQQMLHDLVIGMGVRTQALAARCLLDCTCMGIDLQDLGQIPSHCSTKHSFHLFRQRRTDAARMVLLYSIFP